jgi:DNA replication protein DnaC
MVEQPMFIDRAKAVQEKLAKKEPLTREEEEVLKQHGHLSFFMQSLYSDRGKRYRDCRFENYEVSNDKQRKVVDELRAYAADRSNIDNGYGVVLFGPKGAGKDHLLMALAYEVAKRHGIATYWMNGCDLHDELKSKDFSGHRVSFCNSAVSPTECPIFWTSDPLPPSGVLSEYQQRLLFAVIDERYSNMRPTWTTLNVAGGAEAEERMGAQNVDRLCHGSLVVSCDWPSYRKPNAMVSE